MPNIQPRFEVASMIAGYAKKRLSGIGDSRRTRETSPVARSNTFDRVATVAQTSGTDANGTIVVLALHLDDETFSAEGVIARAHANGDRIGVVVMTDGAHSDQSVCATAIRVRRAAECRLGLLALLGEVPPLLVLTCPDGPLDSRHPDFADASSFGRFLRDLAPVTLLVADPDDNHVDQKAVFGLACRIVSMGLANRLCVLPTRKRLDGMPSRPSSAVPPGGDIADAKPAPVTRDQCQIIASRSGFSLNRAALESFAAVEYIRQATNPDESAIPMKEGAPNASVNPFARVAQPWNYGADPYESTRFARTLAALEDRWYPEAIELGCANGVLTSLLAAQSGRLIAIDPSREALAVAQVRLGGLHNVELRMGHLLQDFPHGNFDLMVLSDFLNHLGFDGCVELAGKLSASAASRCRLVIANYLGDTECALTGEMAAELMIAHLPDWTVVYQERCDRLRMDVLEFA